MHQTVKMLGLSPLLVHTSDPNLAALKLKLSFESQTNCDVCGKSTM